MRNDHYPDLPIDPDSPSPDRPLHRQPWAMALVFIGGVFGTLLRYGVGELVAPPGGWPIGTLSVNIAGAFILGALLEALTRSGPDAGNRQRIRLLVGTGLCGSLTTYSTFATEIDLLGRDGHLAIAISYTAITVIGGAIATLAGIALGALRARA